MSKFARWAALAAFCVALGFVGSIGAVLVLQGHLRGESGPAGSPGPAGPPGPRGEAGPAAVDVDVVRLQSALSQLDRRVVTLEAARGTGGCATVAQVVTDVRVGFGGDLEVSRSPFFVCLNPG